MSTARWHETRLGTAEKRHQDLKGRNIKGERGNLKGGLMRGPATHTLGFG